MRERRRQAAQEFRFRRRELRGREGQAHIVGDEGSDHGGLQGREAPDQPGGGEGVLGAGVVWRTNAKLRTRREAAACARSSETRIPMTASPKRVSVPSRALSAAKAPASLAEGALTADRQGEAAA